MADVLADAFDKATAVKELTPAQLYNRNLSGMSNKQLSRHLRHQRRKTANKSPRINEAFAVVLSTVFDNTKLTSDTGKLMPYLR